MSDNYLHNDSQIPAAMGPFFNHEYINYHAILAQDWLMELKPVRVQANPNYQDWEYGPNHIDLYREGAEAIRTLDPEDSHDCAIRNGDFTAEPNLSATIEPWKINNSKIREYIMQILIYYCTEPDLDLDCDLDLHWSQKLTGGSHGYRHMNFSLFGKEFGNTQDCLDYYITSAKRAWKEGNAYWGWRFLARATHYMADLGHPFHTKVVPYRKFLKNILNKKVLAAAHNGHEVFTQYRFRHGSPAFKQALMDGSKKGRYAQGDLMKVVKIYRKKSAKLLSQMFNAVTEKFGKKFIQLYDMNELNEEAQTMDLSKQTMLLEHNAQKFLFADPNHPGLAILDELTAKALEGVGYMLGFLLASILPFYSE